MVAGGGLHTHALRARPNGASAFNWALQSSVPRAAVGLRVRQHPGKLAVRQVLPREGVDALIPAALCVHALQ